MKNSFQNILDLFSEARTKHLTEVFLEKYWLDDVEWRTHWQRLKDRIFRPESTCLPDMLFRKDFTLVALKGGVLFTEDDFKALQNCMLEAGDKWFVIVENYHMQPSIPGESGETTIHPLLQFKFPVNITWDELLNGGFLSTELFETSYKEFFVFGDSARWGKYAANEYWNKLVDPAGTPLDIIGFKPELAAVFQQQFKQPKEDQKIIRKWLPKEYQKFIE